MGRFRIYRCEMYYKIRVYIIHNILVQSGVLIYMKSKKYIPIITAIIALFASIFLASCTGYRSISGIEMKNKEIRIDF